MGAEARSGKERLELVALSRSFMSRQGSLGLLTYGVWHGKISAYTWEKIDNTPACALVLAMIFSRPATYTEPFLFHQQFVSLVAAQAHFEVHMSRRTPNASRFMTKYKSR